jgi:hypothetical protein
MVRFLKKKLAAVVGILHVFKPPLESVVHHEYFRALLGKG